MQIQNKLALLLTTLFVVGCAGNAANFDLQTQLYVETGSSFLSVRASLLFAEKTHDVLYKS